MPEDLQPRIAEDWVKVQYWECNVIGHRHRSRRSASACIMKRKGESGELKKLKRNLSMLHELKSGTSLVAISKTHFCSDANVTKAVNSSLTKAWKFAHKNGGCPYQQRSWKRDDFTNPERQKELMYFVDVLREMEVKLTKLVE